MTSRVKKTNRYVRRSHLAVENVWQADDMWGGEEFDGSRSSRYIK